MIIDCHGHYTTAPAAHTAWREAQVAAFKAGTTAPPYPVISDEEIRETLESNQLRLLRERGVDMTIFSPRASAMAPHVGDEGVATAWARANNDLIARCVTLYPDVFAGVCMLPQSPKADMVGSIAELRRCVEELGFIGCNLNPDPGGGHFAHPPLTNPFWYPFYEAMVELDVPAMIHVSGSCNPAQNTTGSYYLNADTMAFVQLMLSDLFDDFPKLRLILPHGGGAVPYQWGRLRGIALQAGRRELDEIIGANIFFDTSVYHQAGIDLLTSIVPIDNILFASEMLGAVTLIDPRTGQFFDDTKRYVDAAVVLSQTDRAKIFELNARRVFARLARTQKFGAD